jgi:hypothetical protein
MINALLEVCDENIALVTVCMKMLYKAHPEINWMDELTIGAKLWQPFISRGLSIDSWLSQVSLAIED